MSEIDPTYWVARPETDANGPFTYDQIVGMWNSGAVTADAMICPVGSEGWTPLAKAMSAAKRADEKPRYNVGAYRVIGLILGCIGAHNFYAGEIKQGTRKLMVTILSVVLLSVGEGFGVLAAGFLLFVCASVIFDIIRGSSSPRNESPA